MSTKRSTIGILEPSVGAVERELKTLNVTAKIYGRISPRIMKLNVLTDVFNAESNQINAVDCMFNLSGNYPGLLQFCYNFP